MVFWIGILVAAAIGWQAIKIGFYETWTMAFNITIAVYLAIFLSPAITEAIPATTQTSYGTIFTMAFVAAATFIILHGTSYVFLTSQFKVSFPKVFNILLSGFLGFFVGILAWSFLSLLVIATPVSQNSVMKTLGFTPSAMQTNTDYLCNWCDRLNKFVSTNSGRHTTRDAVDKLLENIENQTPSETTEQKKQNTDPRQHNIFTPLPNNPEDI